MCWKQKNCDFLYLKKKTQEALESYNEKLLIDIVFLWQELVYMESSEKSLMACGLWRTFK